MRYVLPLVLLAACAPTAQQIAARQAAADRQYAAEMAARQQAAEDACALRFPDGATPQGWAACLRVEDARLQDLAFSRQMQVDAVAIEAKRLQLEQEQAERRRWRDVAAVLAPPPAPAQGAPAQTVRCTTVPVYGTGATNTVCN